MFKTIGDLITAIIKIDNETDARAFSEKYLESLVIKTGDMDEALKCLRANIGYCYGEGMSLERVRMWRKVCKAEHPWLPNYEPGRYTDAQLYEIGRKIAEQQKKKSK